MKNTYTIFTLLLASVCSQAVAQSLVIDSVVMGNKYQNQIYYDMATGIKGSAVIKTYWDIAHTTDSRDNCIRANHITGLRVYPYPKGDKSTWSTFDTSGWAKWMLDWNDIHKHERGAFNKPTPFPVFGWGTYSSSTHEVSGDSIYLLVWEDPTTKPVRFLKFQPILQTVSGDLIFRYANVDGSNEIKDTLWQSAANNQNYKFYSFTGKSKPVREPNKANWDITFTQYIAPVYDPNSGKTLPYPLTGVESNRGTKIAQIKKVAFMDVLKDTSNLLTKHKNDFLNDLTAIGSDWKSFNMSSFLYDMADSQSYIVKSVRGADSMFWLIHFTRFDGSSTGKVVFSKKLLGKTNAVFHPVLGTLNVFPNPTENSIFITLDGTHNGPIAINIRNFSGQIMKSQNHNANSGLNAYNLDLSALSKGPYIVTITSGSSTIAKTITVK